MNTLTPEQLDLLKRLQLKFKEAMGEQREGDSYAFEVLPDQWQIEYHDGLDEKWRSHTARLRSTEGYNILFIPKPIDWQNPERGLWGMIDWKKLANPATSDNHKYIEGYICHGQLNIWMGAYNETGSINPFTALLKSLAEQEGV